MSYGYGADVCYVVLLSKKKKINIVIEIVI